MFLIVFLFLSGCSKEGFYQGMYHGLQQREEMVQPSDDSFPPEQPSYETYRREREEVLRGEESSSLPSHHREGEMGGYSDAF
ncbi:MAG: hypothetical protein D3909_10180 [Candidatus Electrothrix sp. ATG1]|nr:hypothetical protein [Candidatus Electrothrix sp. ATG1]